MQACFNMCNRLITRTSSCARTALFQIYVSVPAFLLLERDPNTFEETHFSAVKKKREHRQTC